MNRTSYALVSYVEVEWLWLVLPAAFVPVPGRDYSAKLQSKGQALEESYFGKAKGFGGRAAR